MITRKMTFAEWLNEYCGTNFPLKVDGRIEYKKCTSEQLTYYDSLYDSHLWADYMKEIKTYNFAQKETAITNALEALHKQGVKARLLNHANAHIQAIGENGVKFSYYATSGTITGYGETPVKGVDWLIKLCKGENHD